MPCGRNNRDEAVGIDLFGIKEHDERHDEVERQLRRLVEQVAELTIDLGVTRTALRRLELTVDGKVSEADIDPAILGLNEKIKSARVELADAQVAAEENWDAVSEGLTEALDSLREEVEAEASEEASQN